MRIHTFASGLFQTNTYLVEDETTGLCILVDPTLDSERIYDIITARKWTIGLVVNTHGHVDHVFGDAFFKEKTGAPIVIGKDDAPLLRMAGQQAAFFGVPVPHAAAPDHLLEDDDLIAVGTLRFHVLHTPGHTPGGVCLYGHGLLLSGDTLFAGSIGRTDLPGGDYETLIDSIKRRLLVLPVETLVYSGHGEATTIGTEKGTNPFLTS